LSSIQQCSRSSGRLAGEVPRGARTAEFMIVEKLRFSRTPSRVALMRLIRQRSRGLVIPNRYNKESEISIATGRFSRHSRGRF